MRGTSLPTTGPGISARRMCIGLPETSGAIAMMNTKTPMPPIQWVKLRQNKSPWLMLSTSRRMEAPVVVRPLTVSKNASANEGISPLKTKGNAPMAENESQVMATMTKPSLA